MIHRWKRRRQIGKQRGQRSHEERLVDAQQRLQNYMRRPSRSDRGNDEHESSIRWGFDANGSQVGDSDDVG